MDVSDKNINEGGNHAIDGTFRINRLEVRNKCIEESTYEIEEKVRKLEEEMKQLNI